MHNDRSRHEREALSRPLSGDANGYAGEQT